MQGKFIYVFDKNTRDTLIANGYQLIKADERQNIYVFENKEVCIFSESSTFVLSDTLSF